MGIATATLLSFATLDGAIQQIGSQLKNRHTQTRVVSSISLRDPDNYSVPKI